MMRYLPACESIKRIVGEGTDPFSDLIKTQDLLLFENYFTFASIHFAYTFSNEQHVLGPTLVQSALVYHFKIMFS